MKKSLLWLISLTCLSACPVAAQTYIEAGAVSGIWTKAESPYIINGTVSVPVDAQLLIQPGVEINFAGHYKFIVEGKLLAEGLEADSIIFTASNHTEGWHGLRFMLTNSHGQDTSRISYCRLEYGRVMGDCPDNRGGGIYAELSNLTVTHSLIRLNEAVSGAADWGGGAIYCDKTDAVITDNVISHNHSGNDGGGIYCTFCRPKIHRNIITHNTAFSRGGGIAAFTFANPEILHNTISNNTAGNHGGGIYVSAQGALIQHNFIENNESDLGGGIACYLTDAAIINNLIATNSAPAGGAIYLIGSSPVILSNTICDNTATIHGGGIASTFVNIGIPMYSNPLLTSNIIYGNVSDIGSQLSSDAGNIPVISYCNIQDMDGTGIEGEFNDVDGNIDLPPLFTDAGLYAYELSNASPCIDTGPVDLSGLNCPDCDLSGCIRVWDGNGDQNAVIDMGAWEFGAGTLGNQENQNTYPSICCLNIFPNPAKNQITFKFQMPQSGRIEVDLMQLDGCISNHYSTFVSENEQHYIIDLSSLPAGVYLYQVRYKGYSKSGKIVHL